VLGIVVEETVSQFPGPTELIGIGDVAGVVERVYALRYAVDFLHGENLCPPKPNCKGLTGPGDGERPIVSGFRKVLRDDPSRPLQRGHGDRLDVLSWAATGILHSDFDFHVTAGFEKLPALSLLGPFGREPCSLRAFVGFTEGPKLNVGDDRVGGRGEKDGCREQGDWLTELSKKSLEA
jgi:hypothetical protein